MPKKSFIKSLLSIQIGVILFMFSSVCSADNKAGQHSFEGTVSPFLKKYCYQCHGGEKEKGEMDLTALNGKFSSDESLDKWETILSVLQAKEMPPEDESQPDLKEREQIVHWIEKGIRDYVSSVPEETEVSLNRRLTNFEYENTIRDLIGFRLKLIDNLPKDPVKPYRFNNTAEFMQMGPEQVDRYLENARKIMASVIVGPEKPEVHKLKREWKAYGIEKGLAGDELGVWGNRRNTPATGMGLKTFPKSGEFRIRVKAAGIFPTGVKEIPLRIIMGQTINLNSSTQQIAEVGIVRLKNNIDDFKVFEFRGRMENFPYQPGKFRNGKLQPDSIMITPQNLYDDGTLNDGKRNLTMPRLVIPWIEFESPITDVWPPESHNRILFESPLQEEDPKAYITEVIRRFMTRAYRRPATDEEVARFVKVYELVQPELKTLEASMRETLAMVLVSPQFMYHTLAIEGVVSPDYELASKLSYFLWGSMPDDELLNLAADNKLSDPKVIEQQVRRMIADEKSRDFARNFTIQWLSLNKMKTVPINRQLFPRFLYYVPAGERSGTEEPYRPTIRDYMIDETVGFVSELIQGNESVGKLIESDFAYLNQPLAYHYGIKGIEGDQFRRVPVQSKDHLGGLLTHGSVLIGNGTGTAPHPIYRAVWLREAILGDEVPAPPADVPALSDSAGESAEKALTIKDLLAKHRQKESCNDCHSRLDPWGIPFEQYNAIGKFQAKVPKEGTRVNGFNSQTHKNLAGYEEYLQSLNKIEIYADSRLPNGPEVDGMDELKKYLLAERQEEIAENVIRRFLTYGMGRELTFRDRFKIEELLSQAKENQYKLQDIIVSVCQSPLFTEMSSQKEPVK